MNIDEFKRRLRNIATYKDYRISNQDRKAAQLALVLVGALEKHYPLTEEQFNNVQQTAKEKETMRCSSP